MTKAPPITVEQFRSFIPPRGYRDELIDGEIILSPDPKPQHQAIAKNVFLALNRLFRGSAFTVQQRTNLELADKHSMPSPDVFVIDKARWKAALAEDAYPQGAPQLAVEVISPSNRKSNIERKVRLYVSNGAFAVWVVYPKKKVVEVWKGPEPDLACSLEAGDHVSLPSQMLTALLPVSELFDPDGE